MTELIALSNNHNADIVCVSETLPKTSRTLDNPSNTNFIIEGYTAYHKNEKRGVAIFVKNQLKSTEMILPNQNSVFQESIWIKVECHHKYSLTIGCIYRSPNSSPENNINLLEHLRQVDKVKQNNIVITGDFNFKEIDWKNHTVHTSHTHPAYQMYNTINDLFLEQVVTEPTRYRTGEAQNTLDWILTDDSAKVSNLVYNPPLGEKGDHCVLSFDFESPTLLPTKGPITYSFQRGDYNKMRSKLQDLNWDRELDNKDTESAWSTFKNKMTELIEENIPKRRPSGKSSHPWITKEVRQAINKKNQAWNHYKRNKTPELWEVFKATRNSCHRVTKKAKSDYELSLANDIGDNPKKFWQYVNNKRGCNREFPTMIDDENKILQEDEDKANGFNKYFSSVFTTENTHIPDLANRSGTTEISDINLTEDRVKAELKRINTSKAGGPDNIHPKVISELKDQISYPLYKIFQNSLEEGILPSIWKEALVKPIHKKGNKSQFKNYRPVSLTPAIGKIMERIIRTDLLHHLESNNLLSKEQHGFRSGRSCNTQLLELMEIWSDIMDNGGSLDCVYLDFAKAFDTVPHNRLLVKLKAYGIIGKLHKWIQSFLINRSQKVVINNSKSTPSPVISGIPQGSVLGPILFIIYINDLPDQIKAYTKIFADDTKIFKAIRNLSDKETLQGDLDRLLEWSVKWQLRFNIDKCKIIHFGKKNPNFPYTMAGNPLEEADLEKDLGVTFDRDLKFNHHINSIVNKANSRLGLIKRTITTRSREVILPLYKSLVRPILEYCVAIWHPHLQRDINEIEKVQRRATKLISSIKNHTYSQRLAILKLDSLTFRRRRNDMIQIFRILKGFDKIDINTFFKMSVEGTTRGHRFKISKIRANTNFKMHSFSYRTVNDWNSLSKETVQCETINSFKSALLREWANHNERYLT